MCQALFSISSDNYLIDCCFNRNHGVNFIFPRRRPPAIINTSMVASLISRELNLPLHRQCSSNSSIPTNICLPQMEGFPQNSREIAQIVDGTFKEQTLRKTRTLLFAGRFPLLQNRSGDPKLPCPSFFRFSKPMVCNRVAFMTIMRTETVKNKR